MYEIVLGVAALDLRELLIKAQGGDEAILVIQLDGHLVCADEAQQSMPLPAVIRALSDVTELRDGADDAVLLAAVEPAAVAFLADRVRPLLDVRLRPAEAFDAGLAAALLDQLPEELQHLR